ncbi:MAG: hypothetical protein AAFY57_19205 [Cyanobacteria bacterium J06642_2]
MTAIAIFVVGLLLSIVVDGMELLGVDLRSGVLRFVVGALPFLAAYFIGGFMLGSCWWSTGLCVLAVFMSGLISTVYFVKTHGFDVTFASFLKDHVLGFLIGPIWGVVGLAAGGLAYQRISGERRAL